MKKKRKYTTMRLPPSLAEQIDNLKESEFEPKYHVISRIISEKKKRGKRW